MEKADPEGGRGGGGGERSEGGWLCLHPTAVATHSHHAHRMVSVHVHLSTHTHTECAQPRTYAPRTPHSCAHRHVASGSHSPMNASVTCTVRRNTHAPTRLSAALHSHSSRVLVLVCRGVLSGMWHLTLCLVAPSSCAGSVLLFWSHFTAFGLQRHLWCRSETHWDTSVFHEVVLCGRQFFAPEAGTSRVDERLASLWRTRVPLHHWARLHHSLQFPLRCLLHCHRVCACV